MAHQLPPIGGSSSAPPRGTEPLGAIPSIALDKLKAALADAQRPDFRGQVVLTINVHQGGITDCKGTVTRHV